MNFNKLSKEKRKELFGVAFSTAIALGLLGFGLIKWQYANLREAGEKEEAAHKKLQRMQDMIKHAEQIETELAQTGKVLADLEDDMASGDLYSWVVNTVGRFNASHTAVRIPSFSQPLPADMNLLPKFPYRQVTVTVGGQAHYDELGAFVADFENQFPYIRVVNLTIEPVPGAAPGEAGKSEEKLDFRMDIVSLVKPNPS